MAGVVGKVRGQPLVSAALARLGAGTISAHLSPAMFQAFEAEVIAIPCSAAVAAEGEVRARGCVPGSVIGAWTSSRDHE